MKHLELFSGIGGFRRAMELLSEDGVMDFQSIGYSEINSKAIKTYRANFHIEENEIALGDLTTFEGIDKLPPFDLLSAGFPCQPFSLMGSQAGFNEERGQMFFYILSILSAHKPRYVLLENVKNLKAHNKGKSLLRITQELEAIGYRVFYDIFNTSDFYLPQKRNRILIFATTEDLSLTPNWCFSAKDIALFFEQVHQKTSVLKYNTVCELLSQDVDKKYFLSERIKPTLLADGAANFKSKSDINQVIARPLTATMHKMHRACQDNYYSQDFIESHGKVNPVLTKTKEELAILPIRKLTPEEAFMLQGFPSTFASASRKVGVSDGALYQQAGNAVSVNVIYAVLHYLIANNVIRD
jgi:cytosine-specific methyltransferase nlaX